jgi:hypothetical protein
MVRLDEWRSAVLVQLRRVQTSLVLLLEQQPVGMWRVSKRFWDLLRRAGVVLLIRLGTDWVLLTTAARRRLARAAPAGRRTLHPAGLVGAVLILGAVGAAVPSGRAAADADGRATRAGTCRVTVASAATRPPHPVPPSFNYGNAKIAVALNPVDGKLVAGRLPSGGVRARINPDGSIYAKYGWWRAGSKKPVITGWLIKHPKRRLRVSVPGGYGGGFQAAELTFPTVGCWRVMGKFQNVRLVFTVLVSKSTLGS